MVLSLLFVMPTKSYSQIVQATGNSNEASSQLIYWYDTDYGPQAATARVTNTNDTTGVWIHVQVFRSYDNDGSVGGSKTICDERDFVDFLTPNDTHLYNWSDAFFPKNIGETEGTSGESTSIDLVDQRTKGFVVITPVVSDVDFTAISFQHLTGTAGVSGTGGRGGATDFTAMRVNAMGRAAVDFTTGNVVPDGTPLDGITNGFVVLQPSELIFDFALRNGIDLPLSYTFIVGITFVDNYGPEGLQGYTVTPGSTNWQTFIFDWKEDPTSCGTRTDNCFFSIGLNDDIADADAAGSNPYALDDSLLCAGSSLPDFQAGQLGGTPGSDGISVGWTRIFVSDYDSLENQIGFVGFFDRDPNTDYRSAAASWMSTNR